jgi:hypothetical protein
MAGFSRVINVPDVDHQPEEFPSPGFPVIYADGVISATRTDHNVKVYLFRSDPHPFAEGGANAMPTAQVVMPLDGFVNAATFFVQTLVKLVEEKKVPTEALSQIIKISSGVHSA